MRKRRFLEHAARARRADSAQTADRRHAQPAIFRGQGGVQGLHSRGVSRPAEGDGRLARRVVVLTREEREQRGEHVRARMSARGSNDRGPVGAGRRLQQGRPTRVVREERAALELHEESETVSLSREQEAALEDIGY